MKFLKYFTFELRLRYRNPSQIFFVFIFPLFLMFAFSSSFGKSIPHYIENNIVSFMIIIFCSTLVILVVAHYAYDYEFPKLSLLILFYLKLYLYSIPFCLLAMIIGLLAKNTATASAIAMPLMFLSFFFSGMMIPLAQLSGGIRKIADNFFLTQLLSDLNHTLTSNYTVVPNWSRISLSVGLICLLALLVYRRKA